MTDAPQMRWLRLWTDVIDDPKLLLLAPDDRWYYIALLACKRTGLLDEPDSPDTRDRKVALRLRVDHRERDELRRRLMEVRLIDADWQPCGWENRQFSSDSSAERTRQWRERHRDVTVTPQNRDRAETDTETEQKEELGAPAGLDGKSFARWRAYRDAIGKPLAPASVLAAQRKLAAFGKDQSAVVEQSIAQGWHGLFHVKPNPEQKRKFKPKTPEELDAEEAVRAGTR